MTDGRLVVDLTAEVLDDEESFWSAVAEPLALPTWFGRNLDAWIDTIEGGQISDVVDSHDHIVIRVCRRGLFGVGDQRGQRIVDVTANYTRATIAVVE